MIAKTAVLLLLLSAASYAAEPTTTDTFPREQPAPVGAQNRWPVYDMTRDMFNDKYQVHVLATPTVTPWMMRESYILVDRMIGALKRPEDRRKFAGHRAYLVTDHDPEIPGTRGQRNTGGKGFSLFNEALVCTTSTDTLYPDAKPLYRVWETPVHEFGHAVEFTLGLMEHSDTVYKANLKNYNPKVAREYFAWSTQRWFDAGSPDMKRERMPKWEYDYFASIFDAQNKWVPTDTRGPHDKINVPDRNAPATPAVIPSRKLSRADLEALVGTYEIEQPENDWHRGTITIQARDADGTPTLLLWTNKAGKSWTLKPDPQKASLQTGEGNPYRDPMAREFLVAFDRSKPAAGQRPAGFWFQSALFIKTDGHAG